MERLFDLDMQLLCDAVLLATSVFLLFLILSYLLFNPVRKMLKDREQRIKTDIETAQNDKNEAAVIKAEYEKRLKEVDKEAEEILSEARKKAIANEGRIVAEAKEEAARIIENAKKEAELEKQKVADQVKQEMINVASLMAAKVIEREVNAAIQQDLVDKTLKGLGDSTWQS